MWEYEVICMYSQLSEAAEQQQQNGEEPVGELQKCGCQRSRCDAMRSDAGDFFSFRSLAFPLLRLLFFFLLQGNAANARKRRWAQVGDAICKQEEEKRARPETRRLMGWIEALFWSRSGLGPLLDELALPMRLSNGARAGRGGWCRLLDPLNGCARPRCNSVYYTYTGGRLQFFSLLARLGGGTRYAVPAEVQSGYMEGTCMRDASNGQTMLLFQRAREQSSAELANRETRYFHLLWRNTSHLFFFLVHVSLTDYLLINR